MIVVSDTSPLINLAWIGRFPLLQVLYGSIMIPGAVWNEIVTYGKGRPGAAEVSSAEWISRREARNHDLVRAFRQDLDAGEAEAIALAIEMRAEFLIMDERLGRDVVRQFGRQTIGILLAGMRRGYVESIKSDLDALRYDAGFYITQQLYDRVLTDAGEA